jgi:hypothetical protein
MTNKSEEQALKPLAPCRTLPELFAFVFKTWGEADMRWFLFQSPEHASFPIPRDRLEKAAQELEEVGLSKPAAILWEAAEAARDPDDRYFAPWYVTNREDATSRHWIAEQTKRFPDFDPNLIIFPPDRG